jgi:hypothetical protein
MTDFLINNMIVRLLKITSFYVKSGNTQKINNDTI